MGSRITSTTASCVPLCVEKYVCFFFVCISSARQVCINKIHLCACPIHRISHTFPYLYIIYYSGKPLPFSDFCFSKILHLHVCVWCENYKMLNYHSYDLLISQKYGVKDEVRSTAYVNFECMHLHITHIYTDAGSLMQFTKHCDCSSALRLPQYNVSYRIDFNFSSRFINTHLYIYSIMFYK